MKLLPCRTTDPSPAIHLLATLCFALLIGLPTVALGADWYVAPSGMDGAEGSEAAPLLTFEHAASRAASGDNILLQRGGVYPVSNVQAGDGPAVDAYGSGDAPVLTGGVEVALDGTWTDNASVRTAAVAERVIALYVDGRFVPLARYPDTGFLRVDNDDGLDLIIDSELADRPGVAPGRWTGAQVRWRRWSWWWETRPIANHSANDTLELSDEGEVDIPISDPGSGYFIDNSLAELDAPGEWYWGEGTLYLYPPDWADPGNMRVEMVTTDIQSALVDHEEVPAGVYTSGTSFRNVHFRGFYGDALEINRPATVEDCTFSEIEATGIRYTWDAQPFTIRRNIFRDIHNIAIRGWANSEGPAGSLIERNLLLRIGTQRGYGGNGPWHAAGMIVGAGNSVVVRLNRIVDTGYAGLILGSDGQTVERNVFVRTMSTLNDGGAVYTNCSFSVIRENIILDTIGDLETSHPWWPLGHGIWPEFLEEFHDTEITDNTIYGSNGHGIFLPNNYDCTIAGNVSVDNRRAGLGLLRHNDDPGFDPNQNHVISHNTLAAVVPTRRIDWPENLNQWWRPPYGEPPPVALSYAPSVDFGSMSHTTLIVPVEGAVLIRADSEVDGVDDYDLDSVEAWTADAGWADSTGSLDVRANAVLLFNDTEASREVDVPPGDWTLPDGTAVGTTVSIDAFRSVVLITDAAVAETPPYYAASGIDWRAETPTNAFLTPAPEITVTREGVVVADGGTDHVSQTAPAEARTLTYDIRNDGGAALSITTPTTVGEQSNCSVFLDSEPVAELQPAGQTTLEMTVTPAAEGDWSFAMSFATSDADENPMDWTVSGTASTGGGEDAGTTPDQDAGTTPDQDAGTTPGQDAGTVLPGDTGGSGGPDAGSPGGDAAGVGDGGGGRSCDTMPAADAPSCLVLLFVAAVVWSRLRFGQQRALLRE